MVIITLNNIKVNVADLNFGGVELLSVYGCRAVFTFLIASWFSIMGLCSVFCHCDHGEVFKIANDEERRKLMIFLGSNWYLGNKKVTLTPRKPLDLLHSSNRNQDWRARPDSNRRSSP
jgi:hypothetical protein